MRIGILDVDGLVTIRRSFRLRWRLAITAVSMFYAYVFWLGGHGVAGGVLKPPAALHRPAMQFLAMLLIPATVAMFRRGAVARLYFAALCLCCTLCTAALVGGVLREPGSPLLTLIVAMLGLFLIWRFFLRYGVTLFLSVLPIARGRVYREQLRRSGEAQVRRDQATRDQPPDRLLYEPASTRSIVRLTLLGIGSWSLALPLLFVGILTLIHEEARFAFESGHFKDASAAARIFPPPDHSREPMRWRSTVVPFTLVMAGMYTLTAFAYAWHRWTRNRIIVRPHESAKPLPHGGVLYLRHSRDDVMPLRGRNWTLSRLLFMALQWNFTFEELVARRLSFLGPLHALATGASVPLVREGLDRADAFASRRRLLRWLPGVVARVRMLLPKKRLPPPGPASYLVPDAIWKDVVMASLPAARAIVVLISEVKGEEIASSHLREEIVMIQERGYLSKTLFLMPPLVTTWGSRPRWRKFVDDLVGPLSDGRMRRHAKRMRCLCFPEGEPIFITSSKDSEFFYESVLDMAGMLAAAASEERAAMLTRFL